MKFSFLIFLFIVSLFSNSLNCFQHHQKDFWFIKNEIDQKNDQDKNEQQKKQKDYSYKIPTPPYYSI